MDHPQFAIKAASEKKRNKDEDTCVPGAPERGERVHGRGETEKAREREREAEGQGQVGGRRACLGKSKLGAGN